MRKKVEELGKAQPVTEKLAKSCNKLELFCQELENKIKDAYEQSVTITEAEKLAGEFLHAQMVVAREIQVKSLDARMRKTGVKAVKGAAYMAIATAGDKKPSDAMIQAQVDQDLVVRSEQDAYDEAEVSAEALQNYLRIFEASHIYFRQLSKAT